MAICLLLQIRRRPYRMLGHLFIACSLVGLFFPVVEAKAAHSNVAHESIFKSLCHPFRSKRIHKEAYIVGLTDYPDPNNSTDASFTWWEDDVESDDRRVQNRGGFWHLLWSNVLLKQSKTNGDSTLSNQEELPHPLRTDLWEIQCWWRGQARRRSNDAIPFLNDCIYHRSVFHLEFDPSGYVRLVLPTSIDWSVARKISSSKQPVELDLSTTDASCIGTWKLGPSGLNVQIPFPVFVPATTQSPPNIQQRRHSMEMDFHVNPFGMQPKFTRGIIYADVASSNPVLQLFCLRPIVATFTGIGVGADTVDLSYRKRS